MRRSYRAIRRDRVSGSAILVAGLLCGVSVFFVALPLANSSPFPTPRDGGWIAADRDAAPPQTSRIAKASSYQVASASSYQLASLPARIVPAPKAVPENVGAQAAIEWEARTGSSGVLDIPVTQAARDELETTASLPSPEPPAEAASAPARPAWPRAVNAAAATAALQASVAPAEPAPVKRTLSPQEEVDEYLWQVYQRSPIKKDGSGEFTWKDPAAAKRAKLSLKDYVIGGMNKDFREQLYHAGKAMDEAGLNWTMLSAFRDDYRQSIAAGIKAATGNSLHGGSRATGGYGDGRAADIVNADGDHNSVWRWLDRNGSRYGLSRPMPGYDPAHIQPGGNWHGVAMALRAKRTGTTAIADAQQEPQTPQAGGRGRRTKVAHAR
jgi:hypothetical protein